MTGPVRRELQLAVLLCLLGSGLLLLALSRTWVSYSDLQELTISSVRQQVTGGAVVPGAQALGYVGLAGVVAIAATRRLGRVVVGVLLLAAGTGAAVTVAQVLGDRPASLALTTVDGGCRVGETCLVGLHGIAVSRGWMVLALVGGVAVALAGLLVAVRGRRWAALSAAYEPPTAQAVTETASGEVTGTGDRSDKATWDALDRGDDPTG